MERRIRYCLIMIVFAVIIGVFAGGLASSAQAAEATEQQLLVDRARITFESFMSDPNMAWLKEHLKEAKGLLIVPQLLKAGFIFGGSGGHGVLIVNDEKKGRWSQPAFYSVGSVSFGLQIGGGAVDKMLTTSAKLGADTSIAAGPVGAGVKSNVVADVLSFARSQGAFAGLSLDGSVASTRDEWNATYYGKPVSPVDILVKHSVSNPGSADLRKTVARFGK